MLFLLNYVFKASVALLSLISHRGTTFNQVVHISYRQYTAVATAVVNARDQIMRLALAVFLVSFVALDSIRANPSTSNRLTTCKANAWVDDGCDTKTKICQITCHEPDEECENQCDSSAKIKYSEMVSTKCELLCETSKDDTDEEKRCRFWRWVSCFLNIN